MGSSLRGQSSLTTAVAIMLVLILVPMTAAATGDVSRDITSSAQQDKHHLPLGTSISQEQTRCQLGSNEGVLIVEGRSDSVDQDGISGSDEDADADSVYGSIQEAVHAAEDNGTVCVLPGTYRERVRLDSNITLVAPDGATLNGSTFAQQGSDGPYGIRIVDGNAPVIDGFTITGYEDAILDYGGSGADKIFQ